ncbi:MAG: multiubiquitin domain-containing protein [Acidobacteria bacterium]|nr:multiubiquitin domain-containing protein [Acidobacteriota bacterium]
MSQTVTIYINTKPKSVAKTDLSFDEIVGLAYDGHPPTGPDWSFTVSYHRGHGEKPEGSLRQGGTVKVKEGMIFDVTATNRS